MFLLRISLGWIFFYSGITKIFNSAWSAKGFLEAAKTLPDLFALLASPQNIGWVNFVNEWGQLLIGAALILGVFASAAAWSAILLMLLYYLPGLNFPYVANGYLIDEHIIFILALLILIRTRAGKFFSLGSIFRSSEF